MGWYASAADTPLESPACLDAYKQPSKVIQELSERLKTNQFRTFYKEARKHTLTFTLVTLDNIDIELKEKIWNYYLVALAPTFTFKTYRETEPDIYINDMEDLERKSEACLFIQKYVGMVQDTHKIKRPVKKQIIERLLLPYYARILKQFKNAHEHNPYRVGKIKEPKEPNKEDIVYITSQKQIDELMDRINEIADGESYIRSRNMVVEDEIKYNEKVFLELLVSEFPGQYGKVENFILEAGYSKEDIPNLIDRTVGRSSKTDFLYQGKHRSEHDRLYKKKR